MRFYHSLGPKESKKICREDRIRESSQEKNNSYFTKKTKMNKFQDRNKKKSNYSCNQNKPSRS